MKLTKAQQKRFEKLQKKQHRLGTTRALVSKQFLADELHKAHLKGYEKGLKQKEFDLEMELSRQKKEIRDGFVKIAIKGKDDPDVVKGLYLYTRFLDYLDEKDN